MKKIIITVLFFFLAYSSQGQMTKAVTENGEEVFLYPDGTWIYKNDSTGTNSEIAINPTGFTKSSSSAFLLKSTKANVGVWINPKDWSFEKSTDNEDAEYAFQRKGEDLYGMMITERTQIPIESLMKIAIENARDVAPDVTVIKTEYRTVNGLKVLMMQMNGSIQGVKFAYYGYYYSNANGTVQLLTYTSQNLFTEYMKKMEELLNGFVETD